MEGVEWEDGWRVEKMKKIGKTFGGNGGKDGWLEGTRRKIVKDGDRVI
jgi:hypothetical protein